MTVSLVKTFTEYALSKRFQSVDSNSSSSNKKFYGFNQLWELLQDREDSSMPHGIQDLAYHSLINIKRFQAAR